MLLAGLDLAWATEKNPSGLAIGKISDISLFVQSVSSISGINNLQDALSSQDIYGIAIDAPLIIENPDGMRQCERNLNKQYGKYGSSCHASNQAKFHNFPGVALGKWLRKSGYIHRGIPGHEKWQVECYPHPAIINFFNLEYRLLYKKGRVDDKRRGQIQLSNYIRSFKKYQGLDVIIPDHLLYILDEKHISDLKGHQIKDNEDKLDSIICLLIAATYALQRPFEVFGGLDDSGYIVVPEK